MATERGTQRQSAATTSRSPNELVWRWQQTPIEGWRGTTIWIPPPAKISLEVSGFGVERHALEGFPQLSYELAVSDCSATEAIKRTRAGQPELPISKDKRSGVLVFEQEHIVAGFVINGNRVHQSYRIVVRHDYRGHGLAKRMMLEWYRQVKRPVGIAPQKMNPLGVRTFLAGLHLAYAWAVETGQEVPDKVLSEMASKEETRRILGILAKVEASRRSQKVEA